MDSYVSILQYSRAVAAGTKHAAGGTASGPRLLDFGGALCTSPAATAPMADDVSSPLSQQLEIRLPTCNNGQQPSRCS